MHSIERDSMEPLITKVPDSQLKTSKKPSRWYKVIKKDNKKELNIGVVVEDSAALGPVPLHASGDEVLVAGDEEEVVVDELQPHLVFKRISILMKE